MVNNKTASARFCRLIDTENIRPMKRWSDRFQITGSNRISWYILQLKKEVRLILNTLSGNDIVGMLQSILSNKEKEIISFNSYKEALKNLSSYYNEVELKERHRFVKQLKNSDLNFSKTRRLGFKVSRHLWDTCSDSNDRKKGGGVAISNDIQKAIEDYLKEKSNIASNRLFINKNPVCVNFKKLENARYLEDRMTELYKNFPYSNEISKSTFYKYANLSGEYKKPYRWTDLCDYCESGKRLKIDIDNLMEDLNFRIQETLEIKKMIDISEKD
ncbi:unnamed protein product [Brachionus calyciflorus]|uniref:Uncharacterized protein n=1 Tax=Brachionus calyciflorus TaxID=104777 RepID=A0A813YZG9_9BILA|nr:unnamed protein product [Brachionus calyciflorus]